MTFGVLPLLSLVAYAAAPGPCALLTRADVVKVLHWPVGAGRESSYRLPQSTGERCTYDAADGTVMVVLPDAGSSFLQNNDLVDPFRNGLGTRVPGIGDSAQLFDNTIYLSKHGTSVSVAVVMTNGTVSSTSLTALAKLIARRLP
ncbi:MAG TPA: hypothetical protein VMA36_16315 [Candidatus Limnocylindria bacterium]|jgi:hypothetical protein|nr:hypothetical protein [Candidatus Limnocylindria bacterium]